MMNEGEQKNREHNRKTVLFLNGCAARFLHTDQHKSHALLTRKHPNADACQ